MKKTYLLFFALALMSLSCTKRTDGPVIIEVDADILVMDEESDNLLESDDLKTENLKIYYLINGKKTLYFNGNLDYPKGFTLIKNQDQESALRVFLNTDIHTPVTLIEYREGNTDTIKAAFNRKGASIRCTKIWYNEVLKWDAESRQFPEFRTFTVIKKL